MTQNVVGGIPLSHRLMAAALPCVTTAICAVHFHNGWAALLSYHAVILGSLALWSRRAPIQPLRGRWTRFGVACCVLSVLSGPLLAFLLPIAVRVSLETRLANTGLSGAAWILFVPYFALVNPVLEEMFWRGVLRTQGRSTLLFDLLFASYHLVVLPLFLKPSFVLLGAIVLLSTSAGWRHLSERSGGLLPAIVAHILADIGIVTAVTLHSR